MSKFYDNYLLDRDGKKPLSPNSDKKNILKKEFTLDYTDYEKLKISEQYNKLYSTIYDKNKDSININENKKIYNLSISDLLKKSGSVYVNILNELSIFFSNKQKDKSFNTLGLILTKDDNLLFIGLLILVISFFLWLIEVTS